MKILSQYVRIKLKNDISGSNKEQTRSSLVSVPDHVVLITKDFTSIRSFTTILSITLLHSKDANPIKLEVISEEVQRYNLKAIDMSRIVRFKSANSCKGCVTRCTNSWTIADV